jgi:prevent-host-death family protein
MKPVGVYEAKTQLPRLLERVARGQRVTITKHGVPVAMLIPATGAVRRPVKEVITQLVGFRRGKRLGKVSLRAMISEGRR